MDNATYSAVAATPQSVLLLNMYRQIPSLLSVDSNLRGFIRFNNCRNRRIRSQMADEFVYPSMATFYRAHAAEILGKLSSSIVYQLRFNLGQYDMTRGVFPLSHTIALDHVTYGVISMLRGCDIQYAPPRTQDGLTIENLNVAFPPMKISDIPVEESKARWFVENLGWDIDRQVMLNVTLQLQPEAPKIVVNKYNSRAADATFQARVVDIEVITVNHTPQVGMATLHP